jgi:hypothetical protein
MARFALPHVLAGLSHRIGHDDPVRNARAELDLAERRIDEADDVVRRVEAAARRHAAPGEPSDPAPRTRPSTSNPTRHRATAGAPRPRRPRTVRAA